MHPGSPLDPSGTTATGAKPRYIYSILKPHGQSFRRQVRLQLSKAKPNYVYSISKPHSQSSRSPVRPLLKEAKTNYVYSILKPHGQTSQSPIRLLLREAKLSFVFTTLKKYHLPRVGRKQLCAIAHLEGYNENLLQVNLKSF